MKKGQAAMEFLMTYGWAILVVLIAIGALAYFGVLSPEKFLPEKCVIASGSGLFCDDFSAAATGITVRIHNILNEQVIITSISTDDPICTWEGSLTIAADGTTIAGTDPLLACTLTSGNKIKADLTILYSKGTAGLARSTTGTLVTRVP